MQTTSAIRCSHSCEPAACDPRRVRSAPATSVAALLYGRQRMQRVIDAFAAHLEAILDLITATLLTMISSGVALDILKTLADLESGLAHARSLLGR